MPDMRADMRVYVSLWGGSSYVWPDEPECFRSLSAALDEWHARETFGRSADGLATPLWGDGTVHPSERTYVGLAWVDDRSGESYPDFILTRGPRGGLRWERS